MSETNFNSNRDLAGDPNGLLRFQSVLNDLQAQTTSHDSPPDLPEQQDASGSGQPATGSPIGEKPGIRKPQESTTTPFVVSKDADHPLLALDEIESDIDSVLDAVELLKNRSIVENLAESVLEFSRDAIVVLRGLRVVYCNQLAESLFGVDRSKHFGKNLIRVILKNFEVNRKQLRRTVSKLGSGRSTEQEVRREGHANSIWYEIRLKRFELEGAEHVIVMARDISKRKQYELELARSRDFLSNTINAVPEPLSVKTSDLEIVFVNDAYCQTHDVTREQVIGKTAEEAVPRSKSTEVTRHEQHVLDSGERQAAFEAFIDTHHEQFILSTYRSTFRDQATDETYVVAVSRDVTAEMKRENRLQLLASVFENAQEGVAILNPDGTICEANPEFISAIGKAHSQVLGTALEGLLNSGTHQFSEVISLAKAGRPWFGYVKMLNQNGGEIACWLSLSPSKNRRGETTNLIAMFSDITQIEDTRKELHRQTLHDNLTDLPNRRFFRQRIAELIESDTNGDVRFGVSFLDLDDFKIVNDTLGHDAGDRLLVEVSRRVRESLGDNCFMARFGGDEFALLIPEQANSPLRAMACASAVVESLSMPFNLAGHEVHIGVSVGTTVYPDHAVDVESLMRHADVAMYKAKEEGKNKVAFFSNELVEIVERRQRVLSELRVALDKEELSVVYQPKMCLRTNRIASSEALVRWHKPDGTTVPPNEFIPLAEDFGLINVLGQQVLRTVCLQAREWYDQGVLSGPIAVNLSPRQLKEPNFLQQLVETLEETRVEPSWIELEITENAVMENVDRALSLMKDIDKLGVPIAIDDFGTGYSSLSYIRDFPIRTLKIDITFVRDLPHCSRAVAVAKTVLSLGHGLDLTVVAEGVETVEQLEFLREAGCDVAQGYLISRPLPADKFLSWLKSL